MLSAQNGKSLFHFCWCSSVILFASELLVSKTTCSAAWAGERHKRVLLPREGALRTKCVRKSFPKDKIYVMCVDCVGRLRVVISNVNYDLWCCERTLGSNFRCKLFFNSRVLKRFWCLRLRLTHPKSTASQALRMWFFTATLSPLCLFRVVKNEKNFLRRHTFFFRINSFN